MRPTTGAFSRGDYGKPDSEHFEKTRPKSFRYLLAEAKTAHEKVHHGDRQNSFFLGKNDPANPGQSIVL